MRNLWLGILALLIVLGGLNLAPLSDVDAEQSEDSIPMYTPHAACRINSDTDFLTSSCVTGGDGSQGNPYRIEGWDINGMGLGYAFYIGNTTNYYIIQDNYFYHSNGSSGSSPYYENTGIMLYNVQNGIISNNKMSDNFGGAIYLYSSNLISIADNNAYDNVGGVSLENSSDNLILNNLLSNDNTGIGVISSDNIIMKYNNINDNAHGIMFIESDFGLALNNNLSNNTWGIGVGDSANTNVIANNISGSLAAVELSQSYNSKITRNIMTNNNYGIDLYMSYDINISTNVITNNSGRGISIKESSNNTIIDNSVGYNSYGIYLDTSTNNELINNYVFHNIDYGIYLYAYCMKNNIIDNNISNNIVAIYLQESRNNKIQNNNLFDNYFNIGIIYNSDSNTIVNNRILNGLEGIATGSNYNIIERNIMYNTGITLYGSLLNWTTNSIETSNHVNDKPVYYYKNISKIVIPTNAGQVILANCSKITITGLKLASDSYGISIGYSSNIDVKNNDVSKAYYGIYLIHSIYVNISDNRLYDNNESIHLSQSNSNMMLNNDVTHNTNIGIYLSLSNRNTITNNNISYNNYCGLILTDSSTANQVNHNNFIENNVPYSQSYDNAGKNHWNDSKEGNYWSDYHLESQGCRDNNNDGICDAPYLLDGGLWVKDYRPVKKAFAIHISNPQIPSLLNLLINNLIWIALIMSICIVCVILVIFRKQIVKLFNPRR